MPRPQNPRASRSAALEQPAASGKGSPLAVAKVRPGYQQVADQLRELILEGRINAGERLPTESELTEMFGASRSTVREALRILSSQNLIVTARGAGGGTFVSRPEPRYVSDFLEASFGLLSDSEHLTVAHLLEAREILEVPAAGLAAVRRTDEHLTALRSCFPARGDASRAHLFEGNLLFHITIVEAARPTPGPGWSGTSRTSAPPTRRSMSRLAGRLAGARGRGRLGSAREATPGRPRRGHRAVRRRAVRLGAPGGPGRRGHQDRGPPERGRRRPVHPAVPGGRGQPFLRDLQPEQAEPGPGHQRPRRPPRAGGPGPQLRRRVLQPPGRRPRAPPDPPRGPQGHQPAGRVLLPERVRDGGVAPGPARL